MITKSKQNWKIGATVNVGFLKGLTVKDIVLTPHDWQPDEYILESDKGIRYSFVPHIGLCRI